MGNTQIQAVISQSKRVEQTKNKDNDCHPYNSKPINTSGRIQQITFSAPEAQAQAEENFLKDIYNSNKKSSPLLCLQPHKEFRLHRSAAGQNYDINKSKLEKVVCTTKLVVDKNQKTKSMNDSQMTKNRASVVKMQYQCTIEDIQSENNERILQ